MDMFMHERNLELYRLQLNRTTNDDTRRQLLRLMAEEKQRHPLRAGQTAPDFSFGGHNGSGGFTSRSMPDKNE